MVSNSMKTAWAFILLLFLCVESERRPWYLADIKRVQRLYLGEDPETVFSITENTSTQNGLISSLAVNRAKNNSIFVADKTNRKIYSVTLNSKWFEADPVVDLEVIVDKQSVLGMTSDHVNNYLFFTTDDSLWRVRPDGRALRRMLTIAPSEEFLALEYSMWHNQLVWSVWNRDNSSIQVFIANTPFLSCTHTLYKGDGLINSFSFLGGSLFMLDRSNMQIFMIQKIPGREASWTQIPDVARVMPHFNVSQALSMHMNDYNSPENGDRMVVLAEDDKYLMYCDKEKCSRTMYPTQDTPIAWQVFDSNPDGREPPYMVNLTMFTQPYFFTDMLFFKFTLSPQTYISSYSFKADVRIMTSSKTQFLEPPFFNESLSAIEVVPGEKMNKFTKLSDATTYMVDIYYKENFCEESYFDFLGSHPICTTPSQPYGFLYDGKYVFWNHSKQLPAHDWTIHVSRIDQSDFSFTNLSRSMLPSALGNNYVIYRLEVGYLQSNDSITVFVTYWCGKTPLNSDFFEYVIDKIDEVKIANFDHRIDPSDPDQDGGPNRTSSESATSSILYGAVGFIIVGILFILVHKGVNRYRIIRKESSARDARNNAAPFNPPSVYFRPKSGTLRFGLTDEELESRLSHVAYIQTEPEANGNENIYEEIPESEYAVPSIQVGRNSVTLNSGYQSLTNEYQTLTREESEQSQKRVENIPEKETSQNTCQNRGQPSSSPSSSSGPPPMPTALSAMTSEPNFYSEI